MSLNLSIIGLGAGVPSRVVSNEDLARRMDTSDEWIRTRTGIQTRRIQDEGKAVSHLAVEAGKKALENAGIEPDTIGLVLMATMTPDSFMPATACRVANALGCSRAGALDINIACSGFLYGLLTVAGQLQSGRARRALVIGGDTLSHITNWEDRRTAVLFGDSAGAAVVTSESNGELLGWDYGAQGNSEALVIRAGPSSPGKEPADYKVFMDGKAVFRFATQTVVDTTNRTLAKAGLTLDDIDLVIPHQANRRILESAAKKLGLPLEKFVINLDKYGNTSAGSIPLALAEAHKTGRIQPGHRVLLVGFGGGLSWGSLLLRWAS